jgi:hypothetical protein
MKALLGDRRLLKHVGGALLLQLAAAAGGLVAVLWMLGDTVGALADVGIYFRYASRLLGGAIPYRDFRIEYPPLAVPLFVLPRLLTQDRVVYAILFGCLMFLLNAAIVVMVAAAVRSTQSSEAAAGRVTWYTVCFCVLCPLAVARFDLLPALLATASVLAWIGGRRASGGVLAAIGALVKIFPGLVAGLAFVGDLRQRRKALFRGALAFTATLAAGAVLWLALGSTAGVARSLKFQSERGLEVESIYSGVLLLAAAGGLADAHLTYDETAWHVRTAWSRWVEDATFLLQAAALAAVCWRFYRCGAGELVRWSAAAVVALVAASKILSPQFMLWILPLLALLDSRLGELARKIFLPTCVLTSLVFPWTFLNLVHREALPIVILNLRNALLVALFFLLLLYRGSGPVAAPSRPPTIPLESEG